MAEGLLFGVAQTMIENLGSQIFKEIGSLWGVEDEFENIKNTVSTTRAVLLDAAEQQGHNHQLKDWLEKLKDAVYDADDLLGEFSTEAMLRSTVSGNKIAKEVCTFFSSLKQFAFRREMSRKIKAMREKLDAIAEDRKKFHLKENHSEPHVSVNRETHSFVLDEKVIGREEDKRAIIELLLESNVEENVSVIPIVGLGGLGKTTLAQYVYNDEKVKKCFDLKLWVCVSDSFELKIIVKKIIASATGKAPVNLEIDQLQSQLRGKIDQKKYLLVLDDVWNEDPEKWDSLKDLLMGGSKGQMTCLQTLALFVVSNDSPSISKNVSGLDELNGLNNLRGTLEIRNLERVKDANSESKAAKLWDKKHLEKLRLAWEAIRRPRDRSNQIDNAGDDDEKLLEGLQPHQNLKSLYVYGYGGGIFSNWLSSLTNLVDLELWSCKRCRHPPPLSQLPSLESLSLWEMEDLEYISERDISKEIPTSFFPSLNSLDIRDCPNLKGWWRNASTPDHQQHQHHHSLPSFPLLSSLVIVGCRNLISMPLFPNLEKELSLNRCWKPLQQTMEMASSLPSSSSSPLSKLKSLSLIDIESLPDESLLNLNSLNSLCIVGCPRLTSLSGVLRYLTSLERLTIYDCNEFSPLSDVDDNDGMEWKRLNCLRYLQFRELPKLKSLPAGLQHIATLQHLQIRDCPNLMSFPEWMCCLSSLEKLTIKQCPQLEKKYGGRIGEDWDKIAHIPHIEIEDGIPPTPRGVPQIELKFDIDANGILSVTTVDKGTGKKQDITITGASTLPSDELDMMVKEAVKFAKEDEEKRDPINTKNQADSVLYQTEKQLKELGEKIPGPVKDKVEAKVKELKDATSSGSTQAIKDPKAALNQEVMQLGQSIYRQPSQPEEIGSTEQIERIVDWLAQNFKREQALRLTSTTEKAKMKLSSLTQTNISLPFITATADGPKHIDTTLTRVKFEDLCSDLLDSVCFNAMLSFKDDYKEPNVTVNPDEVVALGAAIQAGVLAGEVSDIVLLDVTPLSLRLETLCGVMTKIIPKNKTLPTSKSEVFSTAADGQTSVEINVCQGEREFVRDNESLGSFCLDGILCAPPGVP
uniref:Rx N-terminal domain-containing protein n=1 Tax=Fagus sylvatica TaxID=28930 RepID=A0A2N9ITQ7_FAGSY